MFLQFYTQVQPQIKLHAVKHLKALAIISLAEFCKKRGLTLKSELASWKLAEMFSIVPPYVKKKLTTLPFQGFEKIDI